MEFLFRLKALKPRYSQVSMVVLGGLVSWVSHAGSFSLYTEGNGYSIGNFAAGVAAEAYDASTGWYNPAGLALIHDQQIIVAGVGVLPSTTLSGNSLFSTVSGSDTYTYAQSFQDLQGGRNGFVPSLYYAKPLGPNATFAISVNAPFGLSTNWDANEPLRYAATLSELQAVDISPEIGGKISEHWAFGAGLDLQYARVKFNSVLGSPATFQALDENPSQWDSYSYNQGSSYAGGYHTGLMWIATENHTRIGLNYQSKVKHQFNGYSRLNGALASFGGTFDAEGVFYEDDLQSNDLEFPDVLTLSGYHDITEKFAILGSVVYTGWSTFKEIALYNVAGFDANTNEPTAVDFVSTENYRDAWRVALGANYRFNDRWLLRVGGGYDQTPTVNSQRTVRLPDADRFALSIGAHYQPLPKLVIDAGYTYLQSIAQATINKTIPLGDSNSFYVNAHGSATANIVGAQINWHIDG